MHEESSHSHTHSALRGRPSPSFSSLICSLTSRLDEKLLQQHRERVQTFSGDLDVPIEFVGVTGEPAAELIAAADAHDADLIVVGTREPGFVERLLGGSVSQGVARRAHRDVLIVHSDEQTDA